MYIASSKVTINVGVDYKIKGIQCVKKNITTEENNE